MRLFITILSMTSVIAFGYALAGYAGYAFGHGRKDYVVLGLALGILTGAFALWLWKRWIPLFWEGVSPEEDDENKPTSCLDHSQEKGQAKRRNSPD